MGCAFLIQGAPASTLSPTPDCSPMRLRALSPHIRIFIPSSVPFHITSSPHARTWCISINPQPEEQLYLTGSISSSPNLRCPLLTDFSSHSSCLQPILGSPPRQLKLILGRWSVSSPTGSSVASLTRLKSSSARPNDNINTPLFPTPSPILARLNHFIVTISLHQHDCKEFNMGSCSVM